VPTAPCRSHTSAEWRTTVAFADCFDAATFGRTVHLTAREQRRQRNELAAARDYGFILRASFEPAAPLYGFAGVIDHLRAAIGAPFAEAALDAAERDGPSAEPPPAAVMPVWAFEPDPDNADVLLNSATLWNCNLLVDALPVEDDDNLTRRPWPRCGSGSTDGRAGPARWAG